MRKKILIGIFILFTLCLIGYYVFYPSIYIGGDIKVEKLSYSKSLLFVYVTKTRGVGGLFSSIATETNLIWGADPFSFEYLGDALAKDKNYVYLGTNKFENKPPKTLKTFSVPLKDDTLVYKRYYVVGSTLLFSMKYNPKHFPNGQVMTWRVGGLSSSEDLEEINYHSFDYDTFQPLRCNYMKDKNGVYYSSHRFLIIENAHIDTFTVVPTDGSNDKIERCEVKDKNYSYYLDKDGIKRRPLVK